MAHQALLMDYFDIPPVTRAYTTACVLTTLAVQLELVSPFQLYFNPRLIWTRYQFWRLITTFLFFGPVGFTFLFNLIFTYRYCRDLEEGPFRGRAADFVVMLAFGALLMLLVALAVRLLFLGQAFTIMLVYVWSRRNPLVRMNFFGLLNFQAPYLPWVLLAFSVLLGNSATVDIVGIMVGHGYYFMDEVFPNQPGGFRTLYAPRWLRVLMNEEPVYAPPPEEGVTPVPEPADDGVQPQPPPDPAPEQQPSPDEPQPQPQPAPSPDDIQQAATPTEPPGGDKRAPPPADGDQ